MAGCCQRGSHAHLFPEVLPRLHCNEELAICGSRCLQTTPTVLRKRETELVFSAAGTTTSEAPRHAQSHTQWRCSGKWRESAMILSRMFALPSCCHPVKSVLAVELQSCFEPPTAPARLWFRCWATKKHKSRFAIVLAFIGWSKKRGGCTRFKKHRCVMIGGIIRIHDGGSRGVQV